jgi:mannose-1-phosphate guanylyltransferase
MPPANRRLRSVLGHIVPQTTAILAAETERTDDNSAHAELNRSSPIAQIRTASATEPRMKALILVGGYGTRLRPLTFSVPKPLVQFANLPIISHQIEAAVKVGVKKVILAVNVQPDAMLKFLKEAEKKYGIEIVCSQENEPMGTAGPLALARSHLTSDKEPFFMFNSDVICDFPLSDMLNFHRAHGGEGTILVTKVQDPSKYGVVIADEKGQIQQFVEKPQTPVGDKINAGIYLFNVDILSRIELKPTSIERDIFPKIAAEKKLYSMVLPGYWMDIGQPKDYLSGMVLHLAYVRKTNPGVLANKDGIQGNVLIDPTAKIGAGAVIGPDVVVGPGVVVGEGARIKRSTLLDRVQVQPHAYVSSSIVGWSSKIGSWSRVTDSTLGEDVTIAPEFAVHDVSVCPHKEIKENVEKKIIM